MSLAFADESIDRKSVRIVHASSYDQYFGQKFLLSEPKCRRRWVVWCWVSS